MTPEDPQHIAGESAAKSAVAQSPTRDCVLSDGQVARIGLPLLWQFALMSTVFSWLQLTSGCMLSRPAANPAPIVFATPPSLPQIIETINANSARVQQLHASDVRLTIPGQMASLNATLDFERERRFRLTGGTRLTGAELDLGSNDESFWMWVQRMQPPTVFYGSHEQFFQSAAQQILPMPPHWIIEGLGIVHLDPNPEVHRLYGSHTPGQLQLHTRKPTPRGTYLQVREIDQTRAWIVKQTIYGPNNEPLAIARAADFQYDPLQNVSLPRKVQVDLPPAGLSFRLAIPAYVLNQPPSDPLSLWSMPRLDEYGVEYRDVANPNDMQDVRLGPTPLAATRGESPGYDAAFTREPAARQPLRATWRRWPAWNIFR